MTPGMPIYWLYTPQGKGPRHSRWVTALVVEAGGRRLGIAVKQTNGRWVPRWVKPDRTKPRQEAGDRV